MVDEVDKDVKTEPKTEVKDFDFETFLAELGKEIPDISLIKSGIAKFGTGNLSDAQKELFLQTIFPNSDNNHLTSSSTKLGFEDMTGIKNTLTALKALQTEGVLTDEQIADVLMAKYPPQDGKNMAMTLALNIRAAEFKSKRSSNPDDILILENNLKSYKETLSIMGQINSDALNKALNEYYLPKNMNRKLNVNDLTAKSETLQEFMKSSSSYGVVTQDENALGVDAQNITEIGGNEALTVDGQPKPTLNVNTPVKAKDDDDAENIANMNPNVGEDKSKCKPFEFEKVKEQDIVQYMFEHWFLEGITVVLKAPFWVADKMIDAWNSKFNSAMPKSPLKPGEVDKNKSAIEFLNDAGAKAANACINSLEQQKDYYNKLCESIADNINPLKDPKDWKVAMFNGRPVLDEMKIREFSRMAQNDPNFDVKLKALKNLSKDDFNGVAKYIQLGARVAATMYMAEHLDGPFDNEAQSKLIKSAMINTQSLMERIADINARVEYNYRAENNIDPSAKLTDAQKTEVAKRAEPVFEKFVQDFSTRGSALRNSINNYHQRMDKSLKADKQKAVETASANLKGVWSPEYLDTICPSTMQNRREEPINLYTLAQQEMQGSTLQQKWSSMLQQNSGVLEAAINENNNRKMAFKNNPIFRRIEYSVSNTTGKINRKTDKVVSGVKEVGKNVKDVAVEGVKLVSAPVKKLKTKLFGSGRL